MVPKLSSMGCRGPIKTICRLLLLSCTVVGLDCGAEDIKLPTKAPASVSAFLESNYGHWSSGEIETGKDGTPIVKVRSVDQPFMNVIDDQDFWLFVHHRTYYLQHIEVHTPSPLRRHGSQARAELRLVHKRSSLWSHIFGAPLLFVSVMVDEAKNPDEENDFLQWLIGGGHANGTWRSKECQDYAGSKGKWQDTLGTSCADYADKDLCTKDGNLGEKWAANRPKVGQELFPLSLFVKISEGNIYGFEHYATDNTSAREGCCACGGGGFHGIWPKAREVIKFSTKCDKSDTEWVVLNSSLYASSKQLDWLKQISHKSGSQSGEVRSLEEVGVQRFLGESTTLKDLVGGEILVNDQRFVVGGDMLSSLKSKGRLCWLAFITVLSFALVAVACWWILKSGSTYSQLEGDTGHNVCHLMSIVLLRWIIVIALPAYAYESGLISLGAGFPWEIHCAMGVLLAVICLLQLHFVSSAGIVRTENNYFFGSLLHGSLAIVASYLECSFIALVGAVQCPLSYTHHRFPEMGGPRSMIFVIALISFICARLLYGMVVGFAGCLASGGKNINQPKSLAILALRSNLELAGYCLLKDKQGTAKDDALQCCNGIFRFANSWGGWLFCFIAVLGQTLSMYAFVRTTGRQLPIIWASIGCTYLQQIVQHCMKEREPSKLSE